MFIRTILLVAAILFVSFATTMLTTRRNLIQLDGIRGELLMLIAPEETRYAPGYSHKKFASIEIGMPEAELIKILGEPLMRWSPYRFTIYQKKRHYIGLQYSESPSSTHYRLRQIYLDSGKVAEVISYYYID